MSDPFLTTSSAFVFTCDRDPTISEPTIVAQLMEQRFFVQWRNTVTDNFFLLISATNYTDPDTALLTWGQYAYSQIIAPEGIKK